MNIATSSGWTSSSRSAPTGGELRRVIAELLSGEEQRWLVLCGVFCILCSVFCIFYFVSCILDSVRSSNSQPDLLLTQHPHFFRYTLVLNTGLSLSEPLQLYQRQSLDSSAGYMYTLWVQQDINAR